MRHVRVGLLWIQERVEEGDIDVKKIDGEQNPADLLTKNVNVAKVERHIQIINEEFREGRAEVSIELK